MALRQYLLIFFFILAFAGVSIWGISTDAPKIFAAACQHYSNNPDFPVIACLGFFTLSSIGMPGLRFLQVLIGSLLDYKLAVLVGIIGGGCGTLPAYLLARYGIASMGGAHVELIRRRYAKDGLYCLFTLRMSAIAPNILINIAAGASGVFRVWPYFFISLLGLLPNILFYNAVGYYARLGNPIPETFVTHVQIALLAASLAPILWRWIHKKLLQVQD